jgi:hypothetical protein
MGFAHHFRPTYALANVGHPSISFGIFCDIDSLKVDFWPVLADED